MSEWGLPPGTQWLRSRGQDQGPAAEIPYGPLQTRQQRLLPQYSALGPTRPLGPGEAFQMPNGNITSEETYTVQLPNGRWAVVPGLWLINGVPHHVEEDHALQLANMSGLDWPFNFASEKEANDYANQREAIWQQTPQTMFMTMQQPALWRRK